MKAKFGEGVRVRFKFKDGSLGVLAQITEPEERRFGHIERGYMGEGFYHITTILDQRNMIAHEDDLVLVDDAEKREHIDTGPHEGCKCKYCNCTPDTPCLDAEYCPRCKTFPSGSGGMTKREAKRYVCHAAWQILDSGGAPLLRNDDDENGSDQIRVDEAWEELLDELYRRGRRKKDMY